MRRKLQNPLVCLEYWQGRRLLSVWGEPATEKEKKGTANSCLESGGVLAQAAKTLSLCRVKAKHQGKIVEYFGILGSISKVEKTFRGNIEQTRTVCAPKRNDSVCPQKEIKVAPFCSSWRADRVYPILFTEKMKGRRLIAEHKQK